MQESPARREFSLAGLNVALQERADEQKVFEAAFLIAVAKGVETADKTSDSSTGRTGARLIEPPVSGPAVSTSLDSIMVCIKNHESGNYTEHSHIYDGSGAYQAIPSTWRAWSARAGYGGYAYEYEAPPSVQDAVIAYMLTHGGAANYSPRYGNDPCTVGFGG